MIPLKDYNPTTRRAWITLGLVLVNVFVYFLVQPHGQGTIDPQSEAVREATFTFQNAAIPYEVTHDRPLTRQQVCQAENNDDPRCGEITAPDRAFDPGKNVYLAILYSMFLHASLLHIAGNMLYFWIFGNNIEDRMGWIGYPIFYLVAGLVAAASQFAVQPNSIVPVVGASGAIAGVMGAYLVLFPRVRIRALIFIIPADVPAYVLLGFWIILQFFTSPNSGVAWVAHVGGFSFGALIALIFRNHLRPPRTRPAWFYGST